MNKEILLGLLLSILPISEIRGGLPILINYCLKNNLSFNSMLSLFLLALILNFLVIFLIYFFLDFLHVHFLKISFYRKFFEKFVEKIRKKHEKFEKRFNDIGYLALLIFVAIPLPGSGAWTGTFLAWLFGLERKKSIIAILFGVLIAGLIVFIFSFGLLSLIRI